VAPARRSGERNGERAVGVEAAEEAGEREKIDCSMVDFIAVEKDASHVTRLTEGSSRMESTSCSNSTLTGRSGCCATLGHTRRRYACMHRIQDPGLGMGGNRPVEDSRGRPAEVQWRG
jgi:hypothetical protein